MKHTLKKFAVTEENTRGRAFTEKRHPYRDDFDRDRDRIIHCGAFRRLEAKTQVFMPGINDHYRTRLTHSIEVAQIGRTMSVYLGLNESLTEAVCLAHDLGHSPFGHSGEAALNEIMADAGGFEHNSQTLRIVEKIENPYPNFKGLNLLYETRLALARHESTYDRTEDDRFVEPICSIEGQIADIADRIAYNCHDFEDGLRSRSNFDLSTPSLWKIDLVAEAWQKVGAGNIDVNYIRNIRVAKEMINILVADVIETSEKTISQTNIETLEDVYQQPKLVFLSEKREKQLKELEHFLYRNMYCNSRLAGISEQVKDWLQTIMDYYTNRPERLSPYYRQLTERFGLRRAVCDYVAGMTDRFALETLEKIKNCG